MRRKQPWMFKGATVLALGKKAAIMALQENTIQGIVYVYYIRCKVEGENRSGQYHSNDIKEYIVDPPKQSHHENGGSY